MDIFGFEIKRKSDEDNAPSFVAPINDDGAQVLEVGQGGYSIGGGMAQGSFIDMEGGVKSEQDLILRYRTMSLIPEVDMAIDDIVQEAISSNDLDAQVGINLDATKLSDSIKSKVRDDSVGTVQIMFALFVFFVSIIIANLIIGLTVSQIDDLYNEARAIRLEKLVTQVISMTMFPLVDRLEMHLFL